VHSKNEKSSDRQIVVRKQQPGWLLVRGVGWDVVLNSTKRGRLLVAWRS